MDKEKIEKEINDIENFMCAEENQDFAFTMSEAKERLKHLKQQLK